MGPVAGRPLGFRLRATGKDEGLSGRAGARTLLRAPRALRTERRLLPRAVRAEDGSRVAARPGVQPESRRRARRRTPGPAHGRTRRGLPRALRYLRQPA